VAEFKIIPLQKELPDPAVLLRRLHEKGFSVEITLNGFARDWGALRFYQDGPTDVECFLVRNEETGSFTASIGENAPPRSRELLLHLVEILLRETRGTAEDPETGKTLGAAQFKQAHPEFSKSAPSKTLWVWPAFAWALVAAGVAAYFNLPANLHVLSLAVVALTLLSAVGLTLSSFEW
jgi:hypothetical protein